MDELDRKIIALLQMDGRASNAKIAREVGVSEGTVRRRLRKLLEDDVVRVVAVPNLEKLGLFYHCIDRSANRPRQVRRGGRSLG